MEIAPCAAPWIRNIRRGKRSLNKDWVTLSVCHKLREEEWRRERGGEREGGERGGEGEREEERERRRESKRG